MVEELPGEEQAELCVWRFHEALTLSVTSCGDEQEPHCAGVRAGRSHTRTRTCFMLAKLQQLLLCASTVVVVVTVCQHCRSTSTSV